MMEAIPHPPAAHGDGTAAALDELAEALAEDRPLPPEEAEAARALCAERGEEIYADLIWALTDLRYEPHQARQLWQEVLDHKYLMSERLGRNVGVRVATLDYFSNFLGRLARSRLVRADTLERLFEAATVDPLTRLANRRAYREFVAAELGRCRRYGAPFSIALFDLDGFKGVNDSFGHDAGDEVLRGVAEAIRSMVRTVDLVARWGGEEFVVVMPATPKRGAMILAERIRRRVAATPLRPPVTISGGLAAFPKDGEDEAALLVFADRALYRAKAEGKDRVCAVPAERRAHPRREERRPLRLAPLDGDGAPTAWEGTCLNIGEGGLALRVAAPLPESIPVRGEIDLGGAKARFVGRISRVEGAAPAPYEVAVEFTEINPEDRARLLAHAH